MGRGEAGSTGQSECLGDENKFHSRASRSGLSLESFRAREGGPPGRGSSRARRSVGKPRARGGEGVKRAANEVGAANAPLIELILRRELDVLGVHVHLVDGGGPLAIDGHRGCRLVGSRAPGAPERRPAEPAAHTTAHARAPGGPAFAPASDAPPGGRAPVRARPGPRRHPPLSRSCARHRARGARARPDDRAHHACCTARPVPRTSRESSRESPPKTASVAVRASVSDLPPVAGVKQLRLARHRGRCETWPALVTGWERISRRGLCGVVTQEIDWNLIRKKRCGSARTVNQPGNKTNVGTSHKNQSLRAGGSTNREFSPRLSARRPHRALY